MPSGDGSRRKIIIDLYKGYGCEVCIPFLYKKSLCQYSGREIFQIPDKTNSLKKGSVKFKQPRTDPSTTPFWISL